jgi:hypothetical protein
VIEWLYRQLESGTWILRAYRSEDLQGEAKPFDRAVVRRLSFDKDNDTTRGPNGQLFYGSRIFSAATMAPKPKEPLSVTVEGLSERLDKIASSRHQTDDEDIPTHALIKKLAVEEFGGALRYAELREIMYRLGPKIDAMKLPAPSRFQYMHALEGMYRKRSRRRRA